MDTEAMRMAVVKIMRPDGLVPLEVLPAPEIIDEDIEATLLGADPFDQLPHLVGNEMIDPDGDAVAAGRRYERCRLLDGFRARSDCRSLVVRPVT